MRFIKEVLSITTRVICIIYYDFYGINYSYRFDQRASVHNQKGVWIPKMNAGMRLRRAMGKKRRNMFRVNPLNGNLSTFYLLDSYS